jgi:hypothetical protein
LRAAAAIAHMVDFASTMASWNAAFSCPESEAAKYAESRYYWECGTEESGRFSIRRLIAARLLLVRQLGRVAIRCLLLHCYPAPSSRPPRTYLSVSIGHFKEQSIILDSELRFVTDRQNGWVLPIRWTDVIFHIIGAQQILGTHLFG